MTILSPWSKPIDPHILFPIGPYNQLLDNLNCKDHSKWLNSWQVRGGVDIGSSNWPVETKRDWFWGVGLPLLSDLERYLSRTNNRTLYGISGLPGCGKTTLGKWVKAASAELNWSVDVISMDDFYLPYQELKKAMSGNPWLVPRALPGSHEIELMEESIQNWQITGELKAPEFDKALRNGLGDRSRWNISTPKILIIEGWFLGCGLAKDLKNSTELLSQQDESITSQEKDYQVIIQNSLKKYLPVWKKFERIWHLKAVNFLSTKKWKAQQEANLQRSRGASIKGKSLKLFLRMIQTAIPKESLESINSDVVAKLNTYREITWIGLSKHEPKT